MPEHWARDLIRESMYWLLPGSEKYAEFLADLKITFEDEIMAVCTEQQVRLPDVTINSLQDLIDVLEGRLNSSNNTDLICGYFNDLQIEESKSVAEMKPHTTDQF